MVQGLQSGSFCVFAYSSATAHRVYCTSREEMTDQDVGR
jgi:hypothetical protein